MSRQDVDGLNAGYASLLLEEYLGNPAAVPAEWRRLFESGDSELVEVASRARPPARERRQRQGCRDACAPGPCPGSRACGASCARGGSRPGAARRGRGGDGARQGLPHGRPPRRAPRPARLRAARRPGARTDGADPEAHARAAVADPRVGAADVRPRRDARRRAAAAAGDIHGHDRLRDRAHLRPREARVAAAGDRVGPLSHTAHAGRAARPAPASLRGRGDGGLSAPVVPRPEAVLARRARRDDPDARRVGRARRRRTEPTRS